MTTSTAFPIVRPKKDQAHAQTFLMGKCPHGYRLIALVQDDPKIPISWHTGPRLTRLEGMSAAMDDDGSKMVPCLDVGGVFERELLTWLTK